MFFPLLLLVEAPGEYIEMFRVIAGIFCMEGRICHSLKWLNSTGARPAIDSGIMFYQYYKMKRWGFNTASEENISEKGSAKRVLPSYCLSFYSFLFLIFVITISDFGGQVPHFWIWRGMSVGPLPVRVEETLLINVVIHRDSQCSHGNV